MMKSLFFLSVLFFVGSYGTTATVTTCSTSTGCSGSDCNTVTGLINPSCQTTTLGSAKVSCENNIYSELTWFNNDCSGAPALNVTGPTNVCVNLLTGGSFKATCSSAPVKVFTAIVIAVIAYFYQ